MNFSNVLEVYEPYIRVVENIQKNNVPICVSGISESAQGHFVYQLSNNTNASSVVICYSDLEAMALFRDVSYFTDRALLFPSKEYVFYDIDAKDHENEHIRLSTLWEMQKCGSIVITSIDAVLKYTADFEEFNRSVIEIKIGSSFDILELSHKFVDLGYTKDECVEGKGQFSVRGGIIDIFPPNYDNPVRIEFFDDEIDGIRSFDTENQRSIENLSEAFIIPCRECCLDFEKREKLSGILTKSLKKNPENDILKSDFEKISQNLNFPAIDKYIGKIYESFPTILDYLGDKTLFLVDYKRIAERAKNIEWELGEEITSLLEEGVVAEKKGKYLLDFQEFFDKTKDSKLLVLTPFVNSKGGYSYNYTCDFNTKTAVSFHGKVDYLIEDLSAWQSKKFTVVIMAQSENNIKNLSGVLKERGFICECSDNGEFEKDKITIVKGKLNKGFEYPEAGFAVVSDREIFDVKSKRRKRRIENTKRIKSYSDLDVGDYVVHRAHGIGVYEGIKKMTVCSVTKDYLQVRYRGTDVLYVPVEQMDMLYKYSGNTEKALTLNKLGGAEWSNTKQRVKKSTEEMAKRLVELYAKRENSKGHSFSKDTVWQREFEDTFEYTETEDQLRSIEEVKEDMEKERPMDRLLCGDVGFGKTEVALRAAFKAVMDGKQVAYLCPTTILAMQHYNTFLRRMEKFPVNIAMLSRFKTPAQQKKIIKGLEEGSVDILVGTHKLLQESVKFKDLGLLIVDEEQRFGVSHKERLKEIKKNVDVLTMTATPIPRTLHMSMISVRDMSVLTEPPENRYPVRTYVLEENPTVLLNAIRNEISRGGQVFYLHNRVQGLYKIAEWIKKNIPEVRVSVGHGKMKEEELEDVMYGMVNGDTDVLVCTTIIETGLDIPNANTIIIDNADKMGLAQLYQLRGRVGRSNRMAYAYLTYQKDKVLSDTAQKRLRAIKEFTEFGSGFKLAMRDLEIRGAGNLLGAEQSGHMEAVGYDMYCRILKESVNAMQGKTIEEDFTTTVDINIDAYIPDKYIEDSAQRIEIYKKIAQIADLEEKAEIEDEMIDRYGDLPKQAQNVVEVAYIKALAHSKGIYELNQRNEQLQFKFERDRINVQNILKLDKKYPGRIKLVPTQKPTLNVKISDKRKIVNEIKTILSEI